MVRSFLSNCSADLSYAQELYRNLSAIDDHVWVDWIVLGLAPNWKAEVHQAIHAATKFYALDSPAYRASISCTYELNLAVTVGVPLELIHVDSLREKGVQTAGQKVTF